MTATRHSALSDESLCLKAQTGDRDAAETLARRYYDQAELIAREFPIGGIDLEDRQSEALAGLLKAIEKWKEGKGTTFKTFAKMAMRRVLIDRHREAHQKSTPPNAMKRSIDVGTGADGDGVTLADLLADGDSPLGGIMDRDDVLTRWRAAREDAWLELVDAVNGEGDEGVLARGVFAFAKACVPAASCTLDAARGGKGMQGKGFGRSLGTMGMMAAQDDLFGSRDSKETWREIRRFFVLFVAVQGMILRGVAEGYQYQEIAASLTVQLYRDFPGIRITPDMVSRIVADMKARAGIEEASAVPRPTQRTAPKRPKAGPDPLGLFAAAA